MLVCSSVKTGVRSVAGNYWIHAAKIGIFLGFEREIRILISDFECSISDL